MLVNVLREDVKSGCVCDPSGCMVARALSRSLREGVRISVGLSCFSLWAFSPEVDTFYGLIPEGVADAIRRFDVGSAVEPFSFDVEVPQRFVREAKVVYGVDECLSGSVIRLGLVGSC